MDKLKAIVSTVFAIMYGIVVSIVVSAGILWVINALFGTQFEMNMWSYIAIVATLLIAHQINRNNS
jgi:hypothetical protein